MTLRAALLGLFLGSLAVGAPGPWSSPTRAQTGRVASPQEAHMLREAAALESRGSLRAAERQIRELLERYPASAAGVFALERVLRAQDRLAEVLPAADAYLSREPRGQAVRFLKLRVLARVDSLDGLREATRSWIEASPESLEPYREAARVWEEAFGPAETLSLLEEGRRRLERPDALPVQVGDLRARSGDVEGAVTEWSRAIGEQGTNLSAVLRRLESLDADPGSLARSLVDHLASEPTTPDRLRAAVRVAVDAGVTERALELAPRVLARLGEDSRRGYLLDLTRRADEAGASAVALWAYGELRRGALTDSEARTLDRRVVELALASGDTARAAEVQSRVVASLEPGSPERRRGLARLIRLRAARGAGSAMLRDLRAFREEFPEAPETDVLAAGAARRLLSRGDVEAAGRVLEGVEGPRSSLERGYLALAGGRIREAVEALRRAAEELGPERATPVVELVTLLGSVSETAATLAARGAVRAHAGDPAAASDTIAGGLENVPLDDRPALLALAARLADDAGDAARGADLRERLVRDFPDAAEAPEAVVRLARFRARSLEGREEAAELLERLILDRPGSAVVPQARRELQRIRGQIPGTRGGGAP